MELRSISRVAFAVLVTFAAFTSQAECISTAQKLSSAGSPPVRVAGALAWSGSVLAVTSHQSSASSLFVAVHDEYLNRLSSDVLVSKDVRTARASVVWNGSEFGLFFQTKDSRLLLQRVSTSGELIGAPVRVTSELRIGAEDSYDVAWSAARNAYAVARVTQFSTGRTVSVWIVEKDGSTRSRHDAVIALDNETIPRVAAAAGGTIGVAFRGAGSVVFLSRLLPSDVWLTPLAIGKGEDGFAIAANGEKFGVARSAAISGARTEVRWAGVTAAGGSFASDRSLVSPTGVDANVVSLTSREGEWALAYNDSLAGIEIEPGVLRIHRFTDAGTRISSSTFAPQFTQEDTFGRFPLTWSGSAFLAASERRGEGDSYLMRLCPVVPEIATAARYVKRDEITTFTAAADGGRPPYAWKWNFGEGSQTETREIEKYRWRKTGTYTVTLTATDGVGATGVATVTIIVVEPKRRAVGH